MFKPRALSGQNNWHLVDMFTLHQAACLWCEIEPASVSEYATEVPDDLAAVRQMLFGAASSRVLPVDTSENGLAMIGNHSSSLVSRPDLEAFARTKNQFPRFLFNTLSPSEADVEKPVEQSVPFDNKAEVLQQPEPVVRRGGRPPEYDWDSFTMEIIRIANHPDGLPDKQANLVKTMLEWFSQKYDAEPAESGVKSKISRIYRYLNEAKNS